MSLSTGVTVHGLPLKLECEESLDSLLADHTQPTALTVPAVTSINQ